MSAQIKHAFLELKAESYKPDTTMASLGPHVWKNDILTAVNEGWPGKWLLQVEAAERKHYTFREKC